MIKKIIFLVFLLTVISPVFSDTYPKVDITGYKKWEYRGARVSPDNNYFSGLTQLGGFTPTSTGTPWQEKLKLKILTRLSEKLTVSYDIEQEQQTPDKYNIELNYDNKHRLIFGDFSATFSGNEFASTTKVLNGMMFISRDEGYELIAVPSTKLKSEVQGYTTQRGNNSKGPYSLGNGSIIEGTEKIELNGQSLTNGKDYVIEYMEGQITFYRILTEDDEFNYSYEYTNISDLFFPSLSHKDFFGFQGRFTSDPMLWGREIPKPQEVLLNGYDVFPSLPKDLSQKGKEEKKGEEDAGRYRLSHSPVVRFSELVSYKGSILSKDKDYTINYSDGSITLLLSTLPKNDDRLQVRYSYKKTEEIQEILLGNGGRGPYDLFNKNIIPFSEQIFINNRPLNPDLDYRIDYENGRIIFNFTVPNTSELKINYKYVFKKSAHQHIGLGLKQELTLGTTYLRESSKSGLGSATLNKSVVFQGSDIRSNDNTIYLPVFPIVPTTEGGSIIVSIDGRILTKEVDYTIPTVEADPLTGYAKVIPDTHLAYINDQMDLTDGYYTGTIKLFTTPEVTQEVSVSYKYYKNIVTRYSGTGNGGRGPYYIYSRNIIPGTEKVEVWNTGANNISVYTRNSSFEADAGDTGYSINYYKDNPYLTFNEALTPDQSFSVTFQYVPPSAPTGNNIKRDVTGFDAEYSLGNVFKFYTNLATSRTNNVIISKSTVEAVLFIAPTKQVSVTKHNTPAMIEGSEKVYVNNYLRNRDIDYLVDYTTGTISFFYITLATADAVVVEYEYPDPGGIAKVGETTDAAYKYGGESTIGDLSMKFNQKATGFDFEPMGGTAIGPGTKYRDFNATYKPSFHEMNASFNYIENTTPIGSSRESFTHSYNRSYSLGANPFGWAGMSMGLRNVETRGDPTTTGGSPSAHSELYEYSGNFNPNGFNIGPLSYNHYYNGRLSDSRNFLENTFSRTKYFHLNQGIGLTRRISGAFDWQFSEPYSLSDYNTTQEAVTSKNRTNDYSYNLNLDLTYGSLQKWTAYAKFINHNSETILPTMSTVETRNMTYHTELIPIDMLRMSYDHNRQETPTVLVEGKNPMSEKASTNITLSPLSYLSTGWGHTEDFTIHDTGRESNGNSNNYSAAWTMFSTDSLDINSNFSKYDRAETGPSGSIEAVTTNTDALTQTYNLTWTPNETLSISPNFTQQDYHFISTNADTLEARSHSTGISVDYDPTEKISSTADYSLKSTSIPNVSPRHKANVGMSVSYKVFDWGEVRLTQDGEYNQGEVLAGGTAPEIDYVRITRTLNLEFTIPQDYPILSAIIFNLAYKTVGYDNRLPGRDIDDLHAAMLTVDGTLHF
jgi:hypothetical protein